ncbi:Threonine--tRNA ligase [Pirellula sp. SH-Sr6A]|uniref:threonine--tRNA ligase n=1 Tax=Pirellula sp. SH-Sr6A TaxID=1632865 RepID=UPI00078B3F61|nr:threonine--tRNA ligase [Pirellula sp. SH-Sr6A]AMV33893.1 Threonine--tRNA ligase [Pirellula sp. SH-Sr6A]
MLEIQLPDGSVVQHPDDASPLSVAESIGSRLAKAVIAAKVGDHVIDATRSLHGFAGKGPIPLRLLTEKDPEALGVLRHSCAHVMARAIMRLFPGVSLAFGPTINNGFYYDFDLPRKLSEEDFAAIEAEMAKIVEKGESFEQFSLNRQQAIELCSDMKQALKVEHIQTGLASHDSLGFYRQGEFVDLCRGPHIPDASRIKAFKVMSVAGSYWKGDASGKQLQRVYGTAWFSQKDMQAYLDQVEEAKKRDHRVIGKKLGLFQISAEVGQGMCLWLPKGARIRSLLEDFLRKEMLKRGYEPVYSPHLGRVELYETSGHFPYYRDSQFPPLFASDAGALVDAWIRRLEDPNGLQQVHETAFLQSAEVLGCELKGYDLLSPASDRIAILQQWQRQHERYLVKPMNCPHHAQIFKAAPRSYKQLPLRLFEFGTVYRFEQTGELNGMLRVRGLTQDDAHIFCTQDQVEQEFRNTIELTRLVLESVGLKDYRVQLSLRDPKSDKYVGSEENWQKAEAALRRVLTESGLNFSTAEGEAAFYGPKADFMVRDCIGRQWQLGTVQLDYNLPERFQLEYVGADNKTHRPVMIHRAPFGSMERFVGMLTEHFAGAFPMWLAPEQVRICPLSEKSNDYALELEKRFTEAGFRVTTDLRGAKVQAKIRDAQLELIPYMAVVGPREAETQSIALRDRISGELGTMPVTEVLELLGSEVQERRIRQVAENKLVATSEEPQETAENEY